MNIFITGGAKGIGKKTAIKLLENGHKVKVIDNDSEALNKLDENILTIHGDITRSEDLEKALKGFEPEILINCAGIQKQGAVEDASLEIYREHIENNYIGYINTIKHSINSIRRTNGRIINISSVAGLTGSPFLSAYCGSKYAVEGFTDSLRMELYNEDIEVITIEPGYIKTGFNRKAERYLRNYIPGSRYSDQYSKILSKEKPGADPEMAASKIIKAVEAKNPKTHYTVTKTAYLVRKIKPLLKPKLWDKLVINREKFSKYLD